MGDIEELIRASDQVVVELHLMFAPPASGQPNGSNKCKERNT